MVIATRVMPVLPHAPQRVAHWNPNGPARPAAATERKTSTPMIVASREVGTPTEYVVAPPAKLVQQPKHDESKPAAPAEPRTAEHGEPRNNSHRMIARSRLEQNTRNDRQKGKSLPAGRFGSVGNFSPMRALGSYALVAEARRYIGTNPTNMARLWCARFMNMVLTRTGFHGTGSDAALSFAHYGRRIYRPRIGAIAVLTRKGGGHVGVVSGIDRRGNPILISGNHGHRVAEAVYPRQRIVAYVLPR